MEFRPILSALARNKTGPLLVAIQVALSLAILVNALHIVAVRQIALARPSGVADEGSVFLLNLRPVRHRDLNDNLALQKQETRVLRGVAGVVSVARVSNTPLSDMGNYGILFTDPRQVKPLANAANYVSPDSLVRTWGLKLVEGRDFTPEDVVEVDPKVIAGFPQVSIVTRALANKLYPGAASVVGKPLYFGNGAKGRMTRIVGVVERLQSPGAQLGERGELSTMLPVRVADEGGSIYAVRAEPGQRDRVMRETETALRGATGLPVIVKGRSMDEDRDKRYRDDRALSWMLVAVSILLLLVTASGIVGMASLWVAQRRRQIGVRRALGARKADILRYFIAENFLITSGGVAGGVLLALGLNQLLVSRLELARLPAAYLAGGAAIFWLLGVAAVYGPAWRAASISPATATRDA
jgi:putative ABC transport system permease protein